MPLATAIAVIVLGGLPDAPTWVVPCFPEPLVANIEGIAHPPKELETAVARYRRQADQENLALFDAFERSNPNSPWLGSLELNLGQISYRQGRFTRTIPYFARAWARLKDSTVPNARRQADRAVAELLRMYARIGEVERVRALLSEVERRDISGTAAQMVSQSREALSLMTTQPESSFWCGPAALQTLYQLRGASPSATIDAFPSTAKGTNLADLARLASRAGRPMQIAFRRAGSQIVVPALVHWKLGHFAALTRREGDRYELADPTFGEGMSVSTQTFDAEASGYCLVPLGRLPRGYRSVDGSEAASVWGKGITTDSDPDELKDGSVSTGSQGGCQADLAMAQYDIHAMLCSVKIWDTPISYQPPIGPAIKCRVTYAQRESGQDSVFTYSNVGPNWRFWYLAYVVDNASALSNIVKVQLMGGGAESYDPPSGIGAATRQDRASRAIFVRTGTNPIEYERQLPDGSKEVYGQDAGGGVARKVFLTKIVDSWGNAVTLQYDDTVKGKLKSITDAGGRVTKLFYDNADPLLITRIADPFGRVAAFTYSSNKKLIAIRDRIGIVSGFSYQTVASPVIKSMTTPYGTTTFECGDVPDPQNAGQLGRFVQATDALGRPERIEFWHAPSTERPWSYLSEPVPAKGNYLYSYSKTHIERRNSFYWDRLNFLYNYPNYDKATIYHWRYQNSKSTGLLESLRPPLQNRLFFAFQGQPGSLSASDTMIGTMPAEIAFVDDAGVSRRQFSATVSSMGRPLSTIEYTNTTGLAYRYRRNTYSQDGMDLEKVERSASVAGPFETEWSATYDHHSLATQTDGAGKTTRIDYTPQGLVQYITNAKGEKTTLEYDQQGRGLLVRMKTADGRVIASYTYDNTLRVSSVTDATGFKVNFTYDALDRPKSIVYAMGTAGQTSELFDYDRLDLSRYTDRQGRVTEYTYNAGRFLTRIKDANGNNTDLGWCRCGKLKSLLDANGSLTTWTYDVQGRPIFKHFADGSEITYVYQPKEGRLEQMTDAKGQTTRFAYYADGRLASRNVVGGVPTSDVSYSYDPIYGRLASWTDSRGATSLSYYPNDGVTLGAGRLQKIDGPLGLDVIQYGYDELGRVRTRNVVGVNSTYGYDLLGSVRSEVNPLGTFTYTYQPGTKRLVSVTGGQVKTFFSYAAAPADPRLATMTNQRADGVGLSTFGYAYDPQGAINKWTRSFRVGTTVGDQSFTYDGIDQLRSSTVQQSANTLTSFTYDYDLGMNRSAATMDGLQVASTNNNLNQLTFEDEAWTSANPNPTYQRTFSYDMNGNLSRVTSLNELTQQSFASDFVFDGFDQLASILRSGNARTDFAYDGLGRRVRMAESVNGALQSQREFLWDGMTLVGEVSGNQIRRYYPQGVLDAGGMKYYFAKDHLGSIRQVLDASGAVVGNYQYDPYGRRTTISETGPYQTDLGFTGYYLHKPTGHWMSPTRLYRPSSGRWISRDPIAEAGGVNLYGYVWNDPASLIDRSGMTPECPTNEDTIAKDPHFKPYVNGPRRFSGALLYHGRLYGYTAYLENDDRDFTKNPQGECVYDAGGNLIKSGPYAGTPNSYDGDRDWWDHLVNDPGGPNLLGRF